MRCSDGDDFLVIVVPTPLTSARALPSVTNRTHVEDNNAEKDATREDLPDLAAPLIKMLSGIVGIAYPEVPNQITLRTGRGDVKVSMATNAKATFAADCPTTLEPIPLTKRRSSWLSLLPNEDGEGWC